MATARSIQLMSLPFSDSSSANHSGTANVGKYQFTPASRTYPAVGSNQTAQNYDTLVFGDVAPGFADRPGGPSQDAAGDGEVAATVAAVALPEVAVAQAKSNFIAAVKTTAIDAKNKLVGFQGDFTFDERVVTFQSEPVQKAGITGGNWNVSGNVLPGNGTDQDAAHIGLLERLHAALRVGNAVRTKDDQGEQGSSRHAIALGRRHRTSSSSSTPISRRRSLATQRLAASRHRGSVELLNR